ncbi:MAG: hypothetical protein GTN99_04085 [Candidatus Dadabacteria bacterium]|nr:hypothetical protein [Candidatus Dadabacteria bacterium]
MKNILDKNLQIKYSGDYLIIPSEGRK